LNLALNVDLSITSFLLTYGITDRIDIGVVVPLVQTSLKSTSNAQINPFGPPPALHFFVAQGGLELFEEVAHQVPRSTQAQNLGPRCMEGHRRRWAQAPSVVADVVYLSPSFCPAASNPTASPMRRARVVSRLAAVIHFT